MYRRSKHWSVTTKSSCKGREHSAREIHFFYGEKVLDSHPAWFRFWSYWRSYYTFCYFQYVCSDYKKPPRSLNSGNGQMTSQTDLFLIKKQEQLGIKFLVIVESSVRIHFYKSRETGITYFWKTGEDSILNKVTWIISS